MQLKLKRSQKASGMLSSTVVFILDARADLTQEERHLVDKYKLGPKVIYNSAAREKHIDAVQHAAAVGGGALLKGAVSMAMAKLTLSITIDSLCRGQHIECKDLDEIIGAEEAVKQGCQTLRMYLDVAATFDGRETVIDFNEQSEAVAA